MVVMMAAAVALTVEVAVEGMVVRLMRWLQGLWLLLAVRDVRYWGWRGVAALLEALGQR